MIFKKSRLASVFALAMVVCMIFGMMVVPASAAESFELQLYNGNLAPSVAGAILRYVNADTGELTPSAFAYGQLGIGSAAQGIFKGSDGAWYVPESFINSVLNKHKEYSGEDYTNFFSLKGYYTQGENKFYSVPNYMEEDEYILKERSPGTSFAVTYVPPTGIIAESVNGSAFSDILNQITDLLPVVVVFLVGAIAITKAISFVTGVIRGA